MSKVWFITGASRGFGREWTIAALERGDSVAATARDLTALEDLAAGFGHRLLPLQLDVTDREADRAAVQQAHEHFGHLDVVVNNAGYYHCGMVEELTETDVRAQFETNFFGALWITQAALPIFRAQRSGHLIQVSSIGGISAFPNGGAYHAAKWALEGLSQSLSQEVDRFGIAVTLIEPGVFDTDWRGASSARNSDLHPDYNQVREASAEYRARRNTSPGNPIATRAAILAIVDADQPPLRIFLGRGPLETATAEYESRLAVWRTWEPVSLQAQG
jgi:NAD(P)-dependent dehydrogenase (short-subunit alcohol dehydrogenase family)